MSAMPSPVQSLGYVGLRAKTIEDWTGYGTKLLGLQAADRSRATLALRMDDRKQRLIVEEDGGEGIAFFGWEVADAAALERLGGHLEAHGVSVARASRALADERHVADLIVIADPLGNRLEFFHGAEIATDAVRAGPQHLGLSYRGARPWPCGAACRAHRRDDGILPRRARLPAQRLFSAALPALFLPREPAPSQHRLCGDRQERGPPHDAGAVQPRRCRPGLRPRRRRGRPHRRDARAPLRRLSSPHSTPGTRRAS